MLLKNIVKQTLLVTLIIFSIPIVEKSVGQTVVVPQLNLIYVKPYWDPQIDQTKMIEDEKRAFGVTSKGNGGYFIQVGFWRHPASTMPITVKLSFWIEQDPCNPHYAPNTKEPIKFKYLKMLLFKLNGDEIDYGYKENDDRPFYVYYTKNWVGWAPFTVYIPWQLFHLWEYKCEINDGQIPIYIRAEVYDRSGRKVGENERIPIVFYIPPTPPKGPKIEDLGTEDYTSFFDEPEPEPEKPTTPEGGSATATSEICAEVSYGPDSFPSHEPETPHDPEPPHKEQEEQHIHEYVREINYEIIPFQVAIGAYESYSNNTVVNFPHELQMEFDHKTLGEENNRYMSRHVLTKGQWASVMGEDDSHGFHVTDDSPFTDITLDEAIIFIEKANTILGDNQQLSIPTMGTLSGAKGINQENIPNYVADDLATVPGEGLYLQLHINSDEKNTITETHYKVIAHKRTICKGCGDVSYKSDPVYRFRTKEMAERFVN